MADIEPDEDPTLATQGSTAAQPSLNDTVQESYDPGAVRQALDTRAQIQSDPSSVAPVARKAMVDPAQESAARNYYQQAQQQQASASLADTDRYLKSQGVQYRTNPDGSTEPDQNEDGSTKFKPATLNHAQWDDTNQAWMKQTRDERGNVQSLDILNDGKLGLDYHRDDDTGTLYTKMPGGQTQVLGTDQGYLDQKHETQITNLQQKAIDSDEAQLQQMRQKLQVYKAGDTTPGMPDAVGDQNKLVDEDTQAVADAKTSSLPDLAMLVGGESRQSKAEAQLAMDKQLRDDNLKHIANDQDYAALKQAHDQLAGDITQKRVVHANAVLDLTAQKYGLTMDQGTDDDRSTWRQSYGVGGTAASKPVVYPSTGVDTGDDGAKTVKPDYLLDRGTQLANATGKSVSDGTALAIKEAKAQGYQIPDEMQPDQKLYRVSADGTVKPGTSDPAAAYTQAVSDGVMKPAAATAAARQIVNALPKDNGTGALLDTTSRVVLGASSMLDHAISFAARFVGAHDVADNLGDSAKLIDTELNAGTTGLINPARKDTALGVAGDIGGTIAGFLPATLATEGMGAVSAALGIGKVAGMLVGALPAFLQMGGQKGDAAFDAAKAGGKSDQDAMTAGKAATLQALPELAAFMAGGAIAGKALKYLTPLQPILSTQFGRGVGSFVLGTAGNIVAQGAVKGLQGENPLDQNRTDIASAAAFALHGGLQGYDAAGTTVREGQTLRDKGFNLGTAQAIRAGDHPEVGMLNELAKSGQTPELRVAAAKQVEQITKNANEWLAEFGSQPAVQHAAASEAATALESEPDSADKRDRQKTAMFRANVSLNKMVAPHQDIRDAVARELVSTPNLLPEARKFGTADPSTVNAAGQNDDARAAMVTAVGQAAIKNGAVTQDVVDRLRGTLGSVPEDNREAVLNHAIGSAVLGDTLPRVLRGQGDQSNKGYLATLGEQGIVSYDTDGKAKLNLPYVALMPKEVRQNLAKNPGANVAVPSGSVFEGIARLVRDGHQSVFPEDQEPAKNAEDSAIAMQAALKQRQAERQDPAKMDLLKADLAERERQSQQPNPSLSQPVEPDESADAFSNVDKTVKPAEESAKAIEEAKTQEERQRQSPEGAELLKEQLSEQQGSETRKAIDSHGLTHDAMTQGMDESGNVIDYHQVTDPQAVDKDGHQATYAIPATSSPEEVAKIVKQQRDDFEASRKAAATTSPEAQPLPSQEQADSVTEGAGAQEKPISADTGTGSAPATRAAETSAGEGVVSPRPQSGKQEPKPMSFEDYLGRSGVAATAPEGQAAAKKWTADFTRVKKQYSNAIKDGLIREPSQEETLAAKASHEEAQATRIQREKQAKSDFADQVNNAAKTATEGKFGDRKIFINKVWEKWQEDTGRKMDLDTFKQELLDNIQNGKLVLTRADFHFGLSPEDLKQSETHYGSERYHFVTKQEPKAGAGGLSESASGGGEHSGGAPEPEKSPIGETDRNEGTPPQTVDKKTIEAAATEAKQRLVGQRGEKYVVADKSGKQTEIPLKATEEQARAKLGLPPKESAPEPVAKPELQQPAKVAEPPAVAVEKVEEHIEETIESAASPSPKAVKSQLAEKLGAALKNAPYEHEERGSRDAKITIHIPGDGTFTIQNTKQNIQEMIRRVAALPVSLGPDRLSATPRSKKQDVEHLATIAQEHTGGDAQKAIDFLTENAKDAPAGEKQIHQEAIKILTARIPASASEKLPDGGATFSKGEAGTYKTKASDVQKLVNNLSKRLPNAPEISVVQGYDDLPENIRDQYREDGVKGFWKDGKVTLIAEKLKDAAAAAKVFAHEVGHHGLRNVVGKDGYQEAMDKVTLESAGDVAKLARERGLDVSDPDQRREAAEEYVAKKAETAGDFLPKTVAWLKDALQKRFQGVRFSDDYTRGLLRDSATYLRGDSDQTADRSQTSGDSDTRFSKEAQEPDKEQGIASKMFDALSAKFKPVRDELSTRDTKDRIAAGFDATMNKANVEGTQARNSVNLDFTKPHDESETRADKKAREAEQQNNLEAAPFVIEAGGNRFALAEMKDRIEAGKDKKLVAKWLPVIDHAMKNTEEIAKNSEGHNKLMQDSLERLRAAGVKMGDVKNYVTHILEMPENEKEMVASPLFDMGGGGGAGSRYFVRNREFKTLAEAIQAGYDPKGTNLADLTQRRIETGERMLNQKALLNEMEKTKAPTDGNPIIKPMETKKIYVADPETGERVQKVQQTVPKGYSVVQVGGEPIAVHNMYANTFKELYGESAFRQNAAGRGLLKAAAFAKSYTLVFDSFHAGRMLYKMGASSGGGPVSFEGGKPEVNIGKGLSLLEYKPEDLARAVKLGEITQKEADYAKANAPALKELLNAGMNVGKVADNLVEQAHIQLPGILNEFNSWLFQKLSRSAMAQSAMVAYERNQKMPGTTKDQAARQTAKEMNEMFGNMQNQGIFRSKTMQDLARVVFLAPNWAESQLRNEGRAYAQLAKSPVNLAKGYGAQALGNSGKAWVLGGLAMLAANQVVNLLTTGKPTWKNEEGHKFDAFIPDAGGGRGFWFNPLEISGEYAHAMMKYSAQGENPVDAAAHIVGNKLSPIARGVTEAVSGRDYTGRHYLNNTDRARGAITDALPMPMPLNAALEKDPRAPVGYRVSRANGSLQKQVMQAAGLKTAAAQSPRTKVFAWAKDFRPDRQKVDVAGQYTELRRALDDSNMGAAENEVQWLLNQGKSLQDIRGSVGINHRGEVIPELFTGSKAGEKEMLQSFTPERRSIYAQAQADHKANAGKLSKILATKRFDIPQASKQRAMQQRQKQRA